MALRVLLCASLFRVGTDRNSLRANEQPTDSQTHRVTAVTSCQVLPRPAATHCQWCSLIISVGRPVLRISATADRPYL